MAKVENINFRVVGVYFKKAGFTVDLPTATQITIKEVMDQLELDPVNNFKYIASLVDFSTGPGLSLQTVQHNLQTPASDGARLPGLYTLSEVKLGTFGSVWQYYVFNPKNTFISGDADNMTSDPFKPFDKYVVNSGDTIVWRLVNILFGPEVLPPTPDEGGRGRFMKRQLASAAAK